MPSRPKSVTPEDSLSESSSDAESGTPVELLVTGRTKRATAGNRLNVLVQREQDELIDLVFEKEEGDVDSEEDIDFIGDKDEVDSDAQLDSSTDDEDHGPPKTDDDLEGEQELQKQIRAERQNKRRAQAAFKTPASARKRVKVDPTTIVASRTPATPASRPKKKSERLSWIPTSEGGPVRASSRKQTIQNKKTVHQRMAEKEKQRIKQMKHMEEAEKKRQAAKTPPMTQAQRMAEAGRTERKNAKSLNRWEESEKQKADVLKAKLEALHNRQLTGPVICWWSGLARWVNGKLNQAGLRENGKSVEAGEHKGHAQLPQESSEFEGSKGLPRSGTDSRVMNDSFEQAKLSLPVAPLLDAAKVVDLTPKATFTPPSEPSGFLEGIHYYASLPSQIQQNAVTATTAHQLYPDSQGSTMSLQQYPDHELPVPIEHPAAFVEKPPKIFHSVVIPPKPKEQPHRMSVEYTNRNLVALRNTDSSPISLPFLSNCVLLKKRGNKVQS